MEKYLYLKGYLKGISMEKYPISKDISRISPWRNISISKDIAESHHGEVSISQRISLESLHRELSYLKGYNYFKNLPMEKYMYVYIKEYLKSLSVKRYLYLKGYLKSLSAVNGCMRVSSCKFLETL